MTAQPDPSAVPVIKAGSSPLDVLAAGGVAPPGGVTEHPITAPATVTPVAHTEQTAAQEIEKRFQDKPVPPAPPPAAQAAYAPQAPLPPIKVNPLLIGVPPVATPTPLVPQEMPSVPMTSGPQPLPPSGQPMPHPPDKKERKELEKKAKQMVKELNAIKGSSGDNGVPKKKPPTVKIAAGMMAMLIVGAGTMIGIKMLGTPGSQEDRSQAHCVPIPGSSACACENPHACVNNNTCISSDAVVRTCHEGSNTGPNCWEVVDECENGDCMNNACGQLPDPGQATMCEPNLPEYGCEGIYQCLNSSQLVERCQEIGEPCWRVVEVCANNSCVPDPAKDPPWGKCGQGSVNPSPTPIVSPSPGQGTPAPACGHFGGGTASYDITACGICNDGNDPRNAGAANGNGFGCNSGTIAMVHFVCNSTTPIPGEGCGPTNGTNIWEGSGIRTFVKDCGMEQIDAVGPNNHISVIHDQPCEETPTQPPAQPSATPTGVQPSATPTPGLACTTVGFSNNNPNYGDTVTLTCSGTPAGAIARTEFQYSVGTGAYQDLTNVSTTTASLTINQIGHYQVRCRVCRSADDSDCTTWQAAGMQ